MEEDGSDHYQQKTFIINQQELGMNKLKQLYERREDSCHSEQHIYSRRGTLSESTNNQQYFESQKDNNDALRGDKLTVNKSFRLNENSQSINVSHSFLDNNPMDLEQSISKQASFNVQQQFIQDNKNEILKTKTNKKVFNTIATKSKDSQLNTKIAFNKLLNNDISLMMFIKKRLLNFFQNKTLSGRNHHLQNQKIKQFICDKAEFIDTQKLSWVRSQFDYCCLQVKKKRSLLCAKIPLFNPQLLSYFIFYILINVLDCLFFIFLSAQIVFTADIEDDKKIFKVMAIKWIIETLIKLNTQIYTKTTIVNNRDTILAIYFKKCAFYDIIPVISFLIIPQHKTALFLLKLLTFLKLKNIQVSLQDIQQQLCMAIKNYYYVQLINLIIKLFFVGHIIACLYYLIGKIELKYLNEEVTWYDDSIGKDGSWWKLYLYAFYWSLTLMATGSNVATTPLQIFFTSFIMCFTTIIFGYFLNMIGIILTQMDEEEENKRRDINIINDFMRRRNISKSLQRRVNLDLEYYYKKNFKKRQEENDQVLSKISQHLNEQLLLEYNSKIIERIDFIKQTFSKESIDQLCLNIEEMHYLPNQMIFAEEDNEDFSIMYIQSGSVELIKAISKENNVNKILGELKQDTILGQLSFFTGNMRTASARAKTFTTILKISRNKFISIIKDKEDDYQKFNCIKDNILLYKNYEMIKIKCNICNKCTHFTSDCPLVHFDREESYNRMGYLEKVKQRRQSLQRKRIKNLNTLFINNEVTKAAKLFYAEYNQELLNRESELNSFSMDTQDEEENQSEQNSKNDKQSVILNENISRDTPRIVNQSIFQFEFDEKSKMNSDLQYSSSNFQSQQEIKKNTPVFQEIQVKLPQINLSIQDDQSLDKKKTIIPDRSPRKLSQKEQGLNKSHTNILQETMQAYLLEQQSPQRVTQKRASVKFMKKGETIHYDNQRTTLQLISTAADKNQQILDEENNSYIKDVMLWNFDLQKDYNIYFPDGNKQFRISLRNQQLRKTQKKGMKKTMKRI